jgi:hypothetical protein
MLYNGKRIAFTCLFLAVMHVTAFGQQSLLGLRLQQTAGGNILTLQGPTSGFSANYTLRLPPTVGGTGSLMYTTATASQLDWLAASTNGYILSLVSGLPQWIDPSTIGTAGWGLSGNSIITAYNGTTGSFIGTTNTQPLIIATTNTLTPQLIGFYTNNIERARLTSTGEFLLGTTVPLSLMTVSGEIYNHSLQMRANFSKPAYSEGRVFYDTTEKALSYYNDHSGITLNIGQENWIHVRNVTGASIVNGQAVYINGADAATSLPTIALARADLLTTADGIGISTETIPNNSTGYVTAFGVVHQLNTSAFTAGATLYLSATTAGAVTTTRPMQPNFTNPIGFVESSNVTTGSILVLAGKTRQGASTTGAVPFGGADGFLKENPTNFIWDNTNLRLGLGTTSPNVQLDITEDFATREFNYATSFTSGSTNNNVTFDGLTPANQTSYARLAAAAGAFTITGFAGGQNGKYLTINNSSGQTLTVANQNAGSLAANRISTGSGNLIIPSGGIVNLQYSPTDSRWIVRSLGGAAMTTTSSDWALNGNTGVTGSNFLGTTDANDLVLRTNNAYRMSVVGGATNTGNVAIGTTTATTTTAAAAIGDKLTILGGDLSFNSESNIALTRSILFRGTAGSGNFRIGADGGDIFWQGGGGQNLQMGAYWRVDLLGQRQSAGFPAFSTSATDCHIYVPLQQASIPGIFVRSATSQTADLMQWQSSTGSVLSSVSAAGEMYSNYFRPNSTTGKPAYAEGRVFYDTSEKALSYYNDHSGITLNIGQENWIHVQNNSGASITNGQTVYINGSDVTVKLPTIALARADALATSDAIGITTETIANGATGYVTSFGVVHQLNTSAFTAGATLYLSPTTAGAVTTTRPTQPNFTNPIGFVETSNATTGSILVLAGKTRQGASTTGAVPFGGSDGFLKENPTNFLWDNTNSRLTLISPSTTDEHYSLRGEASGTSTNQVIGVWGEASNIGSSNTGTIGILATGNSNTTASQTNTALQINDGSFNIGRTTEAPGTGTAVEAATGGTAYTAQGPSGVIELTPFAADQTVGGNTSLSWANHITINNRYATTNSIILLQVLSTTDGSTNQVAGGFSTANVTFSTLVDNRQTGSFEISIGMYSLNAIIIDGGLLATDDDPIRIGYTIINPSK